MVIHILMTIVYISETRMIHTYICYLNIFHKDSQHYIAINLSDACFMGFHIFDTRIIYYEKPVCYSSSSDKKLKKKNE